MAKSTDEAHEPNSDPGATPTEGQATEQPTPEAPPEAASDATADDTEMVAAKRGKVYVTYEGHASVLNINVDGEELSLRPGVPVLLPKNVADDLLTTPYERFSVAEEVPADALQGEE